MSISFTIDGRPCSAQAGQNLLAAALACGIEIPHLCYDVKLSPGKNCGLCLVRINGGEPVRACETAVEEGMQVVTCDEELRSARKEALAQLLAKHRGDCIAPCKKACPAHTNCQGYVGLIAEGHFDEAARLLRDTYPIPASLGRVCPHPCEDACRRSLFEGPVAIATLKRFAGDYELTKENPYLPETAPDTGKKIAVIGGGPAGLTAAWLLRIKGHAVTIFEAMPKAGGMLRYGIPAFRLPKEVLDEEIAAVQAIGVELLTNHPVDAEELKRLQQEYDAVFVGIGAWQSSEMRIPGESLPQVIDGISFLRRTEEGETIALGKHVAVTGGGNTAIDSIRTAIRTPGVERVTLLYRRSEDQMPAFAEEIEEAKEEGIEFRFLVNPVEAKENGSGLTLTLQKMELGEPDASGRRKAVPIEGATEEFACDTLITAIGQHPAPFGEGVLAANRKGAFDTDENGKAADGLYVGGDAANNGPGIAVEAIGDAQRAAAAIDRYLKGEPEAVSCEFCAEQSDLTKEDFPAAAPAERAKPAAEEASARKTNFREYTKTLTPEEAMHEGQRCLECGCLDYYECRLYAYANELGVPFRNDMEVPHQGVDRRQPYIFRDPNKCIACGQCVRICQEIMGFGVWEMLENEETGEKTVRIKDDKTMPENFCISCGQCVEHCPVGALTERNPHLKAVPLPPETVKSVCNFCGVGCSVCVSHYGDKPLKVSPVYGGNLDANVLCVHGRLGWRTAMGDRDLTTPLIRSDGELSPAGFDEAYALAAEKLRAIQEKYGKDSVGVLLADRMTNEEIFQGIRLAEAIGTTSVYSANIYNGGVEEIFGLDGSTNAYQELSGTDCVFVIAADVPSYYAMLALPIQQAKFGHGAKLLVAAADGWNGFNFIADRRAVMEDDTRFLKEVMKDCIDSGCVPENADGFEELKASLADIVPGEEAKAFAADYRNATNAMVVIDRERCSRETARLACELAVVCGKIGRKYSGVIQMLQHNNTQSVSMMKIRSNIHVLDADVKAGKIHAMVLAEQFLPDEEVAKMLDYVVLLDSCRGPAFGYADVFLPMPGYGSYSGTYLSAEGRVQTVRPSFTIPAGRDGWQVLDEFAGYFDPEAPLGSLAAVQEAMADRFPLYAPCIRNGQTFVTEDPIRYQGSRYATDDGKAHLFPASGQAPAFGEMCFADVPLMAWFGELVQNGVLNVD